MVKITLSTFDRLIIKTYAKRNPMCSLVEYWRFGNFRDISDVKNSRLRQGLPMSINDRVILPFREVFFHETSHMRSFAKIKSSRKLPILQYMSTIIFSKNGNTTYFETSKPTRLKLEHN